MAETSQKGQDFAEQNGEFDLPQYILEKYDSNRQVQLIRGYRLLQVLKYHPSNEPFFDKPDNAKRGNKFYYDVIKSPMWLNEIKRKFFSAEYNSLLEVVKDIRLIFENCYYFWGPKSPMTDICLRMERLFEGRVLYLPKELRNICSLEETHDKSEVDVVTKVWSRCRSKGKSCSRLMLRTLKRKRTEEFEEYNEKMNLSKFCDNGDRILKWEERVLRLSDNLRFISSSRELPQIGQLIQLVSDTFNIPNVYQFEIERMLFFPQYSSLFRRIMSVIFSDDHSENSLTYKEMKEKIKSIIAKWYQLYEVHNHNASKVSDSEGIDENFFDIIGDTNPLITQHFEELPYYLRVVILKSIFDHICHCQPNINQIIRNANEERLCPQKIGRDKAGIIYVFFATFPDIRIYRYKPKLATVNTSAVTTSCDNDDNTNKNPFKMVFDDVGSRFKMVADSVEGVRAAINELFYSDVENSKKDTKISNTKIIESLQQFEERFTSDEDERIRRINEKRVEFFNEWLEHCESEEQLAALDQASDEEQSDGDFNENFRDEDCDSVESSKKLRSVIFEDLSNPKAIKMRIGNRISSECFGVKRGTSETEECDSTESVGKYEEEETTEESPSTFSTSSINGVDGEEKTEDDEKCESKTTTAKLSEKTTEKIDENKEGEEDDEDTFHESFTKEMENVKAEPAEQENIDEFCNFEDKPEWIRMKNNFENNSNDSHYESNDFTQPPQSSGSFHPPPVDESLREDEFSWSEEISASEDDDTDDDWEKLNKRSRTKGNKKRKKTPRIDENEQKKSRKRSRLQDSTITEADSNKDVTDSEGAKNESQSEETECVKMQEETVKPKIDEDELSKNDTESTESDKSSKESDKPLSKIKVIDLAKLKNCVNENRVKMEPSSTVNSFIIQRKPTAPINMVPMFTPTQNINSINYPTNVLPRQLMSSQPMMKNYDFSRSQNVLQMRSAQRIAGPPAFVPRTVAHNPNISSTFHGTSVPDIVPRTTLNAHYGQSRPAMNNANVQSTRIRNVPGAIPIPQMGGNVTVLRNMVRNPVQQRSSVREIEGTIGIHSNSGIMQYVVNLANGSHVPLSNEQVQKLRQGNGGILPQKLKIPVPADVAEKIEPFFVLDD